MASELQRRANRANALKSTGPKSEAGKAIVRLNAVRHGLLASAPVMIGEDADAYGALCKQLQDELSPVGVLELQLVERMAGALWRLRRLQHIEAGLLTGNVAREFAEAAETQAQSYTRYEKGGMEMIADEWSGRTVIEDEQAHADAQSAAAEARAVTLSEAALLGGAYQRDASGSDALSKLCRYEAMLERSLHRTGEELRRLQEARVERERREQVGKSLLPGVARRALTNETPNEAHHDGHEPAA